MMSQELVSLILFYNEELSVNDQFIPTNIGRRNRPIKTTRYINLDDLKHKNLRSLHINPKNYTITLTC